MSFYSGNPLAAGFISIHKPEEEEMRGALASAQLSPEQANWFERARDNASTLYFAISARGHIVGQIFLHDMDRGSCAAMAGYHIFRKRDRGRGIGTTALALLCTYSAVELHLRRLVAITSHDNVASRRTAEKAGFRYKGPATEGGGLVVYERTF